MGGWQRAHASRGHMHGGVTRVKKKTLNYKSCVCCAFSHVSPANATGTSHDTSKLFKRSICKIQASNNTTAIQPGIPGTGGMTNPALGNLMANVNNNNNTTGVTNNTTNANNNNAAGNNPGG